VIKRSDFGISFGVPIISDRVDLIINAAFEA
jgi:polyisoprenoid-binding protein YceI